MDTPTSQAPAPLDRAAGRDRYVVVARRYRPSAFEQLVGQGTVARALQSAIQTQRVGHAYLFTGSRGVGKTSAARIFAKALNCISGPTPTPCNRCDICESIATGEDVDVLEIDGASNRGIDEIRQLRSNVNVRPSRARLKIYIIDEVHMLTREAFNALLKTLEEPPAHVKFIFCTTDAQKIPITVLSRCQRFDFAPIDSAAIAQRLQEIARAEGAEADPEAIRLLAHRAAGSMRDGQSLLEQLLAFGGDHIGVDTVHQLLGTARSSRLMALVDHLVEHDAAAALAEFDGAVREGADEGQLIEQLLGIFRDVMATAVGCRPDLMRYSGQADHAVLDKTASDWGLETVLAAIGILDQALSHMRQSVHGRILADMAMVRVARLEDLDALAELIEQMRAGRPATIGSERPADAESGDRADVPRAGSPPHPAAVKKKLGPAPSPPTATCEPSPHGASATASPQTSHELDPAQSEQIWRAALDHLDDMTAEFGRQFESVAISAPNRLVVSFQPKYNSSKSYCERPECHRRLEEALRAVAGTAVRLEFRLLGHTGEPLPAKAVVPLGDRKRQLHAHPMVRQAMEIFGAEVSDVEVASSEDSASG
jgi:DNA polymerase-3 subunit gamma/tau